MWIRNLTCRFLVVKARLQSQDINLAALVAFNYLNRLVAKADIDKEDSKVPKVACSLNTLNTSIVHIHQSMSEVFASHVGNQS